MPHDYSVDLERRLVRIRAWGVITRAEIITAQQALASDPRVGPDFAELIDLRELTSTANISGNDVRQLASLDQPIHRRAFVAPDSATFGLARMFIALRLSHHEDEQISVFRTLQDAEVWLAGAR